MAKGTPAEQSLEVDDIDTYLEQLSGASRRERQDAAHALALLAKEDPTVFNENVEAVVDALIDALSRPEAQTRWEAFDALSCLCSENSRLVAQAYDAAEIGLFDEQNERVCVASFRLLCFIGASNPKRSEKVWPLLDEAIQCFHGDMGYRDMLEALVVLAEGSASKNVKAQLAARLAFDSENGRGYVKTLSSRIVEAAQA